MRWLQKHIKHFSLSKAWRWYYRKGRRKGYAAGLLEGRKQGNQENACPRHELPLTLQTVQLMSGTLIEGWFCPMWYEHSAPYPVVQQMPFPEPGERHTDRIPQPNPLHVVHHALRSGRGPHTAVQRAMRPRDLDNWKKEQGEG